MTDSTRIADLPENITMNAYGGDFSQGPPSQGGNPVHSQAPPPSYGAVGLDVPGGAGMQNANYVQMNVHPNPYGHGPPQHGSLGLPQHTHTQKNPYATPPPAYPQHPLPSRDIPQDTTVYSNDAEIVPNYIPPAKNTADFVKEYEQSYEKKEKRIQAREKSLRTLDDLFLELRVPIIISMLFLLFQSPMFHTMVIKHFAILAIHNEDGNLNVQGLLLKSALFGGAYYALEKITDYLR